MLENWRNIFFALIHDIMNALGTFLHVYNHIDGLVQKRRNSIAKALELRLSYTNGSKF